MSAVERDAFLASVLDAQISAEIALHNGDVNPRRETWSHEEPVTLFGAAVPFRQGWTDVLAVFEWLAPRFSACKAYDFELLAAGASGDLAYTVGVERYDATTASGEPVRNALRVTHVYRREAGGWKIVHRHGDHMAPAPEIST